MSVKERIMPALHGAFAAAMTLAALPSQALDNVWYGTGDGYWETSANWSAFSTGNYWVMRSDATSKAVKFKSKAPLAYTLAIATEGMTFSADSGTCGLVQSTNDVRIGAWETGSLAIESGTHVINELAVASAWWGKAVDGTLTMNGGKLTVSTASYIGSASEANATGTDGLVTVNNGELVFSQAPVLGVKYGTTGTIDIDGGTVATPGFTVDAGTATVNLDGGTLKPTEDGATLIPSGVLLTIGDTESTIELSGQTVTIEGAVAGVYGTDQTTGKLKVKGWGKLIVTGEIKLDTLTISPNDYYSSDLDTYTLVVEAKSAFLRHLYGAGDLVTTSGVNTGDGAFYGKISGSGGLRTRGATTLYGLNDFTGGITFADNASLILVSSLDGISPLWRVDASDESTITKNSSGNVTTWASKVTSGYQANGVFANSSSTCTTTTGYFGGKTAVLSSGSTLTSSWTNDGNNNNYHTTAVIGAVAVQSHNANSILLKYIGGNNYYLGRYNSNADYWTKMHGSKNPKNDGVWQNGVYMDQAFHSDGKVLSILGDPRYSGSTSLALGAESGASVAIGELVAFNSNPTTAQRRQIETYLANKWNIEGMGKSLPEVELTLGANSTLDLGGLDVTVKKLNLPNATCTIKNGSLSVSSTANVVTQAAGDLTIPAAAGATYKAAAGYSLYVTGTPAAAFTIGLPDGDVASLVRDVKTDSTLVAFTQNGETLDGIVRLSDGTWHYGDILWTGASESSVKYWDDEANWDVWDPANTTWRTIYKPETIYFRGNTGPVNDFQVDAVKVVFAADGEYGFNETGGWMKIGAHNDGELEIESGTHRSALDLRVGSAIYSSNTKGVFTLKDGAIFKAGYWIWLGAANAGLSSEGVANIEGGELVAGDNGDDWNGRLIVGGDANCSGTLNQSGGLVSSVRNNDSGYAMVVGGGASATGVYNLSGGEYEARYGRVLLGESAGAKGTLNITGGTFTAEGIDKGQGTAEIFLDGGTLAATGTTEWFISSGVSLAIGEHGGRIDTQGRSITIGANLKGSGMLAILGGGTVTFTGDRSQFTGTVAELYVGEGETQSILGNAPYDGAIVVGGTLKIATPYELEGCDLHHDFGTDDFDANFTEVYGGLAAGDNININGRAALHSDTFGIRAKTASKCLTSFAVVQLGAIPAYVKLFMSETYTYAIQEHNTNGYWVRRASSWDDSGNGIWLNGVEHAKITTNPTVVSVSGAWTRNMLDSSRTTKTEKIVCGTTISSDNKAGTPSSMTWGEVLLYNRELSATERQGVESYLMKKWGISDAYNPLTSANDVYMTSPGAVLDLGGLDLTVNSFTGCGTVSNGTLRTVDKTYTQGEGALTIPAVNGATYYASSSRYKLRLDDAAGKSVTIVIPENWFQSSGNLIFCQGDATFVFEGEEIELKKNANGWYTNGDTTWIGESESTVKYWDDIANWSGSEGLRKFLDGVDASGVTFRSAETLEGNLYIETTTGGGVTFLAEGDGYGLSQPGNKSHNTFVGYASNGELTVDGGRHHFANDLIVGSGEKKSGAVGDFALASGRVETEYWLLVGAAGGTGNVYVDGGELLVGVRNFDGTYYETGDACIDMCRDANSKGNFYLTGGAVRSETGSATGCALLVGNGANSVATFTISGGYYTARNAGEIRLAGGAGSKGTLNVEGGTIYVGRIAKGLGTAELFIDGGTLAPQASGTFIASGIETTIGDNGGTIYLEGQDIVIDGDIAGAGDLAISGWGSVTVKGKIELGGGTLTVDETSQTSLVLTADNIDAGAIEGTGTIVISSSEGNLAAGGGTFYGIVKGNGGFKVRGATTLYGLGNYAGSLSIADGGSLALVSSIEGLSPLWRVDASETASLTIVDGKVTNWTSLTGNGYFSNAASAMTLTTSHFGGMNAVVTQGSTLTSSWSNDGSAQKIYHTQSVFGSIVTLDHSRGGPVLLSFDGGKNCWFGRRQDGSTYDNWTKMSGSGNASIEGIWQNGVYKDVAFHNDERVIDFLWYNRISSLTSLNIGGSSGSLAIGELIAFNYNPDTVQRKKIESYLANKWNVGEMGRALPYVAVEMEDGTTLDLGGLDVNVPSFHGSGTVRNGTLVTADKKYTQGNGALTIPAVDGATYYASNSDSKLEITGGAGKTVTIHIPAGWLGVNTNTYTYITCDAKTVNFTYGDANGEEKRTFFNMGDGRYRFGTAAAEEEDPVDPGDDDEPVDVDEPEEDGGYDFGSYSTSNSLDDANEDALDDAESGLAFPGAYGWGRFAKGARASSSPSVYHVVNLNDSGTGSLRDAVSKPNRIVVFDVSGVIKISSRITFASNLYVAGQTAPGEGITVYGNGCSFSGANNLICRYIRWRMGHIGSSGKDCAGIANGANMIFDHCSFSWGLDETFSINPDGKGTYPQNITLQNCIFGQGLMTHSAGGLMQANYITLYRNLYVDNSTRNNKVKGINQYANNIVYNWKNGCYIMGGDSSGSSYCTITGNLFINGPVSSSSNALGGGNSDFHFYGDDNWQDKNRNGRLDASLVTHDGGGDSVSLDYITAKIGAVPSLPMYAGNELLEKNLGKVGASLPYRDQSDCYMIDEVRTVGTSGGLITYEDTLAIGAPDTWKWWSGTARADSDNDGIPDAWEEANGLDKTKNDSLVLASNGRYNIENYINSITAGDRQFFLRAPVTLKADTTTTKTVKLTWRDYTYGEIGFSIEKKESSGAWTQVGRAKANATAFKVGELVPGTYYTFRVRAVGRQDGALVYSDSAEITVSTREQQTGEVDIDTYKPNFTFKSGEQSYWDKNHRTWTQNTIYLDSDDGSAKVLLNTSGDEGVTVTASVAPASIVANGTGTMTVNRVGNITGATTINKGNIGTLKLVKGTNGTNAGTYTGKVVNHGGVIEFDSIANGGYASALGKSTSDPLNWVFDGGTYRYTGGSASTDRSATFRKDSTLEIANSGTTLTMTGAMEGTGDFILDGEGTLAIPNANTFFGSKTRNAVIKGGTLHLTTTGDSGSARNFANGNTIKNLYLAGGNVKFTSKDEEYQTYSVPIYIEDGTTNEISLASHCYMNSRLIGNGDVQFNIEHVRSVFKSNMSSFTGNVTAHGNWTKKSTGKYLPTFYHASYWNYPNTRFNLTGDIHMASKARNVTCHLGGLSGTSGTYLSGSDTKSSGSGTTWYVGYANSNEEFAGTIDDYNSDRSAKGTTSIVKVGTGYWRLTGTSVHSGTTTVNGGALIVNGTLPASSAVIVNDGGTLQGNGTIHGSITVNDGGTIRAGDYISDDDEDASGGFDDDAYDKANLYFDGGITLNSGARVVIPVARTTSGDLVCPRLRPYTGTSFSIAEGVTLEFDLSKVDELKANEKIYIMSLVPSFKDHKVFDAIEPATPGHGLKWDTSKLYTDKYISVVKDDDFVWNLEPAAASGRTALVAASSTDAAFDALTVKRPATTAYISEETYKEYFKYSYSKSGGNYTVSVTGIADDVVDEVVNSTIDALLNQDADSDGYITIAVKPGLYYGIAPGTRANIDAPTRYLAGDFTWKFKKPSGNSKFVRIDIGASATDSGAFTGASVLVTVLTVTNGGTLDLSTFSNATATPRGHITLRGKATLALLESQTANLDVGDSFTIFDNPAQWTVNGSFTSIDPEKPGANMAWDMSKLNGGSLALSVVSKIEAVSPAEPQENLTEKDANELAANGTVAAPDDLTSEQQAYYASLFSLVAFPSGDMWTVAALMNENGTNTVAECANAMIKSEAIAEMLAAVSDADANAQTVSVPNAIPGLYYSVSSAAAIKNMKEAGERKRAGSSGVVELTFPHYKTGSAFYQILINSRK